MLTSIRVTDVSDCTAIWCMKTSDKSGPLRAEGVIFKTLFTKEVTADVNRKLNGELVCYFICTI